jgi:DNA-binding NarL/FixJ family response regulator
MAAIVSTRPDVALVDLVLNGMHGLEFVKALKRELPALPILVLSMHDESVYAERALRAGANGYVMKQEASEKVIVALRHVMAGKIHTSDAVAERLMGHFVASGTAREKLEFDRLSDREVEVFHLIGHGRKTTEIADDLNLSPKTVETHRAHIKQKLRLASMTELIHRAVAWNLTATVPSLAKTSGADALSS